MNPTLPKTDTNRDSKSSHDAGAAGSARTPNADMQAEDTGSADSAGDAGGGDDSATAATRAMKQTSKTAAESGGKR